MRLLGPAPSPGLTAFASSRSRLQRGSMLRMTSRKKVTPLRNGIAAARRKGAYPLGRSIATQTIWEDAMSAIPSGSFAGRTNTLRQECIEVRRSSLAFQTDYTVANRSVAERDRLFLVPCWHPPRFICNTLSDRTMALYCSTVHQRKKHPAGTLTPRLNNIHSLCP